MEHIGRPTTQVAELTDDGGIEMKDRRHFFRVPYLGDKNPEDDYMTSFHDYPARNLHGIVPAAAIQLWLYFLLLREIFWHICGIDYDWRDFVHVDEGRGSAVITTDKLNTLLYLWHAREADAPIEEKLERLRAIKRTLIIANSSVMYLGKSCSPVTADVNLDDPEAPGFPVMASVLLSVKILGATLCDAIPSVYADFIEGVGLNPHVKYHINESSLIAEHIHKFEFHSSHFTDPIISQLLERAGYCPFQAATCDRERLSQGNLTLRWYLTYLNRRAIPGDHSGCTMSSCIGYDVQEDAYMTRHLLDRDCNCDNISLSHMFDTDVILSCTQEGGTPLIRVDWPYIRIFRMGLDEGPIPPYVAISHVWSQGMGNPRENGLPQCQLSNLQYSATKSCPEIQNIHFWIDTLCIPVGKEAARRQEIKKMASIYSGAEKVVVIDRSLMQAMSKVNREEVLIRIWKSPWASRLWTLQESRLAKSLSFYFADGFYELEHVSLELSNYWKGAIYYQTNIPSWLERYKVLRDPVCYRMIEAGAEFRDPESMRAWEEIRDMPFQKGNTTTSSPQAIINSPPPLPATFIARIDQYNKSNFVLATAWQSLQSLGSLPPEHQYSAPYTPVDLFRGLMGMLNPRSLTRAEDEAVCLATTLGIAIDRILKANSSDERMRILLKSVGTLPLGILFVNCERMSHPGQSWMPRTLIQSNTQALSGLCEVQPDERLLYQGAAFISARPFAVDTKGSYFSIEVSKRGRFFIGVHPQPGLQLNGVRKTYIIIPSYPTTERQHIPQKVAVLSQLECEEDSKLKSGRGIAQLQTKFEFNAWLFEMALSSSLSSSSALVNGNVKPGQYSIFQPPREHWWQLETEGIEIVPFVPTSEKTVLIG